jgi:hypothetical protein
VASLKRFGVVLFSRVIRGKQREFAVIAPFRVVGKGVRREVLSEYRSTSLRNTIHEFTSLSLDGVFGSSGNTTGSYAIGSRLRKR